MDLTVDLQRVGRHSASDGREWFHLVHEQFRLVGDDGNVGAVRPAPTDEVSQPSVSASTQNARAQITHNNIIYPHRRKKRPQKK